jgi:hypothetical protein
MESREATAHRVEGKMRPTVPRVAIGVLLWALSAFPAASQEVLGKTIQAKYSLVMCSTNGVCLPAQARSVNIYVSKQGHVFDYGGFEKGTQYTLGVSKHLTYSDITVTASDNKLLLKAESSKYNSTYIYEINGNTCRLEILSSARDQRMRVSGLSCSVVDGNPN